MAPGLQFVAPVTRRQNASGARGRAGALALLLLAAGCSRDQAGNLPVGERGPSRIEQERYVRRLHIDLAGAAPSDEAVSAAVAELAERGNTAATRREMAQQLMAQPAFAEAWVGELVNRAFEGDSISARIGFMCGVFRTLDCSNQCSDDVTDPCADCDCSDLPEWMEERAHLEAAADDFHDGASTSSIERRFAMSDGFQFPLGPDAVADLLFEAFLGRPVEPDEQRNAAAMVQGSFIPNSPAGLLFHRHGEDYTALIDIVFTSEPYRDATVDGVFMRYLGRHATPAELRHFSSQLDPANPDLRPLIEAVVSSKEYFDQ